MYKYIHPSFVHIEPEQLAHLSPPTIPIQAKINVIPAMLTASGPAQRLEIDSFITGPGSSRRTPTSPHSWGGKWVGRPTRFEP